MVDVIKKKQTIEEVIKLTLNKHKKDGKWKQSNGEIILMWKFCWKSRAIVKSYRYPELENRKDSLMKPTNQLFYDPSSEFSFYIYIFLFVFYFLLLLFFYELLKVFSIPNEHKSERYNLRLRCWLVKYIKLVDKRIDRDEDSC